MGRTEEGKQNGLTPTRFRDFVFLSYSDRAAHRTIDSVYNDCTLSELLRMISYAECHT